MVGQQDPAVDRIISLPPRPDTLIESEGYGWFVKGENIDYLASDAILLHAQEAETLYNAAEECLDLYQEALAHVARQDQWSKLRIPSSIVRLIRHDLERKIPHICGRIDFAGGIGNFPIKLLEFNADTPTSLPESAYFQKWQVEAIEKEYDGQLNYLIEDLTEAFAALKAQFPDKPPLLLLTGLGFVEDRLNLMVIKDAAQRAGFEVDYADLESVVFADDGVYLQSDAGYVQYPFLYKLVPWETIILREPELLDILIRLSIEHDLIILNPSYSLAFQAKHMLSVLYELFPDHPLLLPTFDLEARVRGRQYVRKVNFGRMGENIQIIATSGQILAKTTGDFGHFSKIYQEFAEMYQDEDGDIYQPSMYVVRGKSSCLNVRRRDGLIIDDDAEFVPHLLFE